MSSRMMPVLLSSPQPKTGAGVMVRMEMGALVSAAVVFTTSGAPKNAMLHQDVTVGW
jgi:hypothetical protein